MQTYKQALITIAEAVKHLPEQQVDLTKALGRVAQQALSSEAAVPPFDNSAMDGFALRSADTKRSTADTPVRIPVVGTLTAGQAPGAESADSHTAWEIMTGSPIPPGYDCVVPLEQVEIHMDGDQNPQAILLRAPVERDRNLRRAGEDFQPGAPLLEPGTCINAGHIMGLAATGIKQVMVSARPRIAAVTTGNELATPTNQDNLRSGMIHDANGPYLSAAITEMKLENAGVFQCGDSEGELIKRIDELSATTDIILTTGGVSAGRMDFVPAALKSLGAEILFHKIAIRPGKPILLARIPEGPLVFGLPGNPVAVAVGFRFFVIPALLRMQNMPPENYPSARLMKDMRKKPGMAFFAKAHVEADSSGQLLVHALPGQESFKINPLMRANCWIVADPENSEMAAGETVRIAPLLPGLKL